MEYADIKDKLQRRICLLRFIKKDGSERTLYATLAEQIIGYPIDRAPAHAPHGRVLPVWSMEDNGWRSFNLDNVLEFRSFCSVSDYWE